MRVRTAGVAGREVARSYKRGSRQQGGKRKGHIRSRIYYSDPFFAQDRSIDEWAPPKVLVRRLFRMRKPFERYGASEP